MEAKHKYVSRVQAVYQGRHVHHTDNTQSDSRGKETRPAAASLEDLTQIQNQKSCFESAKLKKFANQILHAVSNHLYPLFYFTKCNSIYLFHLYLSPSPVELSHTFSFCLYAYSSQPSAVVLTLKFLIALSSHRSFHTFFLHTCLPLVSPINPPC